jgi:hypothetical protein
MKTIKILRELITWYYYLLAIGLLGLFIAPFFIFNNNKFEIDINGTDVNIGDVIWHKKILTLVLVWTLYILYFKAIYHLRNSLQDLSSGNYFSDLVILSFKKAGQFLLYFAIGSFVFNFLLGLILNLTINISFSTEFLLHLIMALFFMFLSEAFLKGKNLQEENELTV